MNIKAQKLLLLLFLLTGFINNSCAINTVILSDTANNETVYFESEIEKFADDSIKLDIVNRKAYLFGNAKIKYQHTTISASYIEINWNKNTIYATYSFDSLGNKIGYPVFTEGQDNFKAQSITYNFKTEKCSENSCESSTFQDPI